MEARRFRNADKPVNFNVTSSNLPGIVIIVIGLLITITGIIIMAAFGLDQLPHDGKQIAGPVISVIGAILTVVGLFVAAHLRKKQQLARSRAREMKGSKVKIHPAETGDSPKHDSPSIQKQPPVVKLSRMPHVQE